MRGRRELQPLLFSTLSRAGRLDALDSETRAAARRAYLGQVARNSRLLDRAAEILDAARARSLDLLPLKGALFAAALYPDPGERPMSDLDLLVRPRELEAACALLTELGFRRAFPPRARFSPEHGHDVAFTDERDPTLHLELHFRLFHELAGDASVERLFERAIPVHALGRTRRAPAWEDHLFIVLVHAATHAFGDQPSWPFDAALLCERTTLASARAEADRRGYGIAFREAARLAARLLPSQIELEPDERATLRSLLLERALGPEPLAHPCPRLRSLCVRALLTDDPRDAAREVARKLQLRWIEAGERWRGARTQR